MTLKELRISKHLTQSQCAELAGVSLRTYQNYEKDVQLVGSARYNSIYKTIEQFGITMEPKPITPASDAFYTNVKAGDDLVPLCKVVSPYKKRDCFQHLSDFVNGNYDGRVCILYGLRRTGKTTLLFQMIKNVIVSNGFAPFINKNLKHFIAFFSKQNRIIGIAVYSYN